MAVRGTGWLRSRADAWRSGSVRAQWWLAATLVLVILLSLVVSLVDYDLMPLTAYFLWLLIARILLSFRPLVVVATVDAVAGSLALLVPNATAPVRLVAVVEFLVAVLVVLYVAGRLRSTLPSTLSEALLGKLRDRRPWTIRGAHGRRGLARGTDHSGRAHVPTHADAAPG